MSGAQYPWSCPTCHAPAHQHCKSLTTGRTTDTHAARTKPEQQFLTRPTAHARANCEHDYQLTGVDEQQPANIAHLHCPLCNEDKHVLTLKTYDQIEAEITAKATP